jgi:hypothetical protein
LWSRADQYEYEYIELVDVTTVVLDVVVIAVDPVGGDGVAGCSLPPPYGFSLVGGAPALGCFPPGLEPGDAVAADQVPPKLLIPWPCVWPAPWSPEKRYRGMPRSVT